MKSLDDLNIELAKLKSENRKLRDCLRLEKIKTNQLRELVNSTIQENQRLKREISKNE